MFSFKRVDWRPLSDSGASMKVRLLRNPLPAAATILVLALVAGACGSDEEAADARHGVFEDTEAEFARCETTFFNDAGAEVEEVDADRTVTRCPDGAERVTFADGGGYMRTAADPDGCQSTFRDEDSWIIESTSCQDGSRREVNRDGGVYTRSAPSDPGGCVTETRNDDYDATNCADGSGYGNNHGDVWERTLTAEGCWNTTHGASGRYEVECDDGSGSGQDSNGIFYSRTARGEHDCQTTTWSSGPRVSATECDWNTPTDDVTIYRAGYERTWPNAYDINGCRTVTWSEGFVVVATETECSQDGVSTSSGDWFEGLSYETTSTEETDADGTVTTCRNRLWSDGAYENRCQSRDVDNNLLHSGDSLGDPNVPFEQIIRPGIAEDPDNCTLVVYEGILEGTMENCRVADGESSRLELNGYVLQTSIKVDQNAGSYCHIMTTTFGSSFEMCDSRDGSEMQLRGTLADGTPLSDASSERCTGLAAVDDSDYMFEWCQGLDGFRGTMRDGTEWETRSLSGNRVGFYIADVLSEISDRKRPTPSQTLEFPVSPAMCSTILGEGYPPIALMCRALEVVPAYSTEFVPSQEALDAAAAQEEARLAQEAAAQAEAVAAAEQAAAEQAAAEQAEAEAAAEQAAAAQAEAEAAAEQAAAEQAAAEAAAAEAAAAQAAAEQALAEAAAEAAAGLVSTGYTAEELASVTSAADFLGISVAEFQSTGVYVIDFLTQLAGGYESVTPLTDPPDVSGSESVTSTWDEQARGLLGRVSSGYGTTDAETQKFGAILLTFFVGIARG